jgi:hypothetical protein
MVGTAWPSRAALTLIPEAMRGPFISIAACVLSQLSDPVPHRLEHATFPGAPTAYRFTTTSGRLGIANCISPKRGSDRIPDTVIRRYGSTIPIEYF